MSDCIDARIMYNLQTVFRSITIVNNYKTGVKTVDLLRSVLRIEDDDYPYCLVIPNEMDPQSEFSYRDDVLSFMIWYLDGKSDELPGEPPFTWRLRNVAADFIKALKVDPTLGGLAQNVRIPRHNFGLFVDENIMELGVYMFIEVDRQINPGNPYQLA